MENYVIARFILLLFIAIPHALCLTTSLRLVIVVFRHGDRSPVKNYPTDKYTERDWPQGYGQLTTIGMKDAYRLGQFLRSQYYYFLWPGYKRNETYIRSTDVDRTLMSASCVAAGLFPPNGSEIWNQKLPWQPVPVHAVQDGTDYVLRESTDCARYTDIMRKRLESKKYQQLFLDNKKFIDRVCTKAGYSESSLLNAWHLYDTLFCETNHKMELPEWATKDNTMAKLRDLKVHKYNFKFDGNEVKTLRAGPLINRLLLDVKEKASGKTLHRKLILYSAHDTTLGSLMVALGIWNYILPPYAAALIFEVTQLSGEYYVNIRYRNNTANRLYPLTIPGCQTRCKVTKLESIVKPIRFSGSFQAWQRACRLSSARSTSLVAVAVVLVMLVLLAATGVWWLWRRHNRRQNRAFGLTSEVDMTE